MYVVARLAVSLVVHWNWIGNFEGVESQKAKFLKGRMKLNLNNPKDGDPNPK